MKRSKILMIVVPLFLIASTASISRYHQNYTASLKKGTFVKALRDDELTPEERGFALFDGDTYIAIRATDGNTYHAVLNASQKKKMRDSVTFSNFNNGNMYLVR